MRGINVRFAATGTAARGLAVYPRRPLSRWVRCLLAAGLLLSLMACKEEKIPEHVQQQRVQAEHREERERLRQQQLKQAPKPEEETWPLAVQEAYYALALAKGPRLPLASRQLGQLGLPAAQALRKIASTQRHSPEKRSVASLLLVDLHMFRPGELAQLAQLSELPVLQRGAIEGLARIGNKEALQALTALRQQLVPETVAAGRALSPEQNLQQLQQQELVAFFEQARKKQRWGYTAEQLATLDRLLQAQSAEELEAAISWLKDLTLEQGLLKLLTSAATRLQVQEAVAHKFVSLTPPRQQLRLTQPQMPPVLRIAAAQVLLSAGSPQHRAHLVRLSENSQDPFAPVLQQLLAQSPSN